MLVSILDITGAHHHFKDAGVELLPKSGILAVRDKETGILTNYILENLIYYTVQNDRNLKAKGDDANGASS